MYLSLFLILTNAIHKKQRNAFAYLRNLRNVLPWIHLLHRQLTILSHKQNKKLLRNFNAMQFSPAPNREEKKERKKKRTMRTLRRSSVSEAMRPLLGRPKRISVRWRTPASSNGPFTSATWDCCDGAQHTKTVRLKGKESVEPERHGWSIDMDIAFSLCYSSSSVCVTVFEREREK